MQMVLMIESRFPGRPVPSDLDALFGRFADALYLEEREQEAMTDAVAQGIAKAFG